MSKRVVGSIFCALPLMAALVTLGMPVRASNVQKLDDTAPLLIESDGATSWGSEIEGAITDADGRTVSGAYLILDGREHKADSQGLFRIPARGSSSSMMVKKAGFRKMIIAPRRGNLKIALQEQIINGAYLQTGILKNKQRTEMLNMMELLRVTELNALVIDVKDDDGRVSENLKPYIDELKAKGIYTIARIVAFKDNREPRRDPSKAILTTDGKVWADRHNVAYLDPYNQKSWDYLISVSKYAVEAGFDEIQFDYVRFPTDGNRSIIKWNTTDFSSETRTKAIAGFLAKARKELGAMGAFVAADVFGDTAYVKTDSGIGQRIEDITLYLDYVCPMVYPSGYAMNSGGVKGHPVAFPKEIVADSVRRYRLRADKETVIRPWLQSFKDYAYDKRPYGGKEIRAQIEGSDSMGGEGFLLWNAASRYSADGLNKKSRTQSNGGRVVRQ